MTDRFKAFLIEQNGRWPLSSENYRGLSAIREKVFAIGGHTIKVQFNPERIRSSAAKVDKQSIAARSCFLCAANRPKEQDSIPMTSDFILLVNPFPIFNTHFTLPTLAHTDQRLMPFFDEMLVMARQLEGYTVFYNGPECGASAPDHLHFQAGENGFLPVEEEFEQLKNKEEFSLFQDQDVKVWAFDHYLRKMMSVKSSSLEKTISAIRLFFNCFSKIQPEKVEPMLNVLCYFKNGTWTLHLFPRRKHRPVQYFAEGEEQLLISPASVDFGGVFILPRKEDFEKITPEDVTDIFSQVTLDQPSFDLLKNDFRLKLQTTS